MILAKNLVQHFRIVVRHTAHQPRAQPLGQVGVGTPAGGADLDFINGRQPQSGRQQPATGLGNELAGPQKRADVLVRKI